MMALEGRLHQLFVLNVALQLFDGVATWHGAQFWGEGNPFLHAMMTLLGFEATLLLFKAKACVFLVVLRRCWRHRETHAAMSILAAFYGWFSFVPWMTRFLSLLHV